jgi:ABC-type branched-subunit amino acid transport system permease subunit
VSRTKLLAFGIAAGIAGIGGVMLAFKQNDVSSANFEYGASLAFLAFAYLGGITSINGAIVGGLLTGSGIIAVGSNYMLKGTDIDKYIVVIGGASLVFTSIVHPNGIAPALQDVFRHIGRWLVKARGKEWLGLARRVGPTIVVGAVVGYLIWPARVDTYRPVWMMALGAYIALILRAAALGIYRKVQQRRRENVTKAALRARAQARLAGMA